MKIIGILIACWFAGTLLHAQDAGNRLAAEGKYKDAALSYTTDLMKGAAADQVGLLGKIVDIDPDLPHLFELLEGIAAKHPSLEIRSRAHAAMGSLLVAMMKLQDARLRYRTAMTLWPDNHVCYLKTALLGLYVGDLESVRIDLDALVRRAPPKDVMQQAILLSSLYLVAKGRTRESWNLMNAELLADTQISPEALAWGIALARSLGFKDKITQLSSEMARRFPLHPSASLAWGSVPADSDGLTQVTASVVFMLLLAPLPAVAEKTVAPATGSPRAIQLGVFSREGNALAFIDALRKKDRSLALGVEQEGPRFKVILLLKSSDDANRVVLQLKDLGIEGFIVY